MPAQQVLVLCEPGRRGRAALQHARELAEHEHACITVVAITPQAASGARCGNSALDYNLAVHDAVARELARATEWLAGGGASVASELLVEGTDPSLEQLANDFDLVLLPRRRSGFGRGAHPATAALRRTGRVEVLVVDRRGAPR